MFKKETENQILIHEVLSRSDQYNRKYAIWKSHGHYHELLNDIRTSYELKLKGIEQNPHVHILNSQYANGIAIGYSDYFVESDFPNLSDLFAERIMPLGYKTANKDLLIRDKSGYTESIEKYYLKPIINSDPPLDQKFGNILVEHVKINDKPSYLKLSANVYNDRLYSKALDFKTLLEKILSTEE